MMRLLIPYKARACVEKTSPEFSVPFEPFLHFGEYVITLTKLK